MKNQAQRQYTIRKVPPSIDRALRKKAREQKRSLNSVVLEAMAENVGLGVEEDVYADLDFLIGSWVQDPKTDQVLKTQREVDLRDWQ